MHNVNVDLPNVYFVTLNSAQTGTLTLYVAGDFTGAVVRKVQRYCREHFQFCPYRSNSSLKMRRFRLGDYVENPQGLLDAYSFAVEQGEWDVAKKLAQRPKEVQYLLELGHHLPPDADAVWEALSAEMEKLEVANG